MFTQHQTHRLALIMAVLCGMLLSIIPLIASAQAPIPMVTKTAEYNFSIDCPVSATLSPDNNVIWVLMDNCGHRKFTLQGFNIADGSPVDADGSHFADSLAALDDQTVYSDTTPLAFTPDGALDIIYNETQNYDARNLRLSLTNDQPPASNLLHLSNDTLQKLIPGYKGYPETITYSPDHTLASVSDTDTIHIIDLQIEKDLFQIVTKISTDFSTASFSTDNQRLYITTIKHPDDMQDNSSTLNIYNVTDGTLLNTYDVPTYFNDVSPDERFIAGQLNDKEWIVTELATGSMSVPVTMPEKPHEATECLNTGTKISADLGYVTRGELPVRDLIWLPDSSGFLTVNSSLGDGSQGGGVCLFDYSRLRVYQVK